MASRLCQLVQCVAGCTQFDGYSPDCRLVPVVAGSFHQTDSNEGSFELASMRAFAKALMSLA